MRTLFDDLYQVAPGYPDAGGPLVSCGDYAGPLRDPFEVRGRPGFPGSYNYEFTVWLRERDDGGAE